MRVSRWLRYVTAFSILLFSTSAMAQNDVVNRPGSSRTDMEPASFDSRASGQTRSSNDLGLLAVAPEGTTTLGSNGLSLVGNVGYQISGSSVQLTADRVENSSTTRTSGTLRLALWLSEGGYRATGYRTATYQFSGVLGPLQYFYNIAPVVPFTAPPTGCYYVSMLLEEYQSTGSFAYVDYVDFTSNRLSVNGGCNSAPPCAFTLSSAGASAGAAGGAGSVNVNGSPNGCSGSYSAVSNESWITITSGAGGSGSGSHTVTFSLAPNSSTSSRTGSLTIAGQSYVISQAGVTATPPCNYSVSPQSASVAPNGGSGSVNVTGSPSGCSGGWSASSNASWISIISGSSGSGSGSETLTYTVAQNTSSSRSGSITVAGQPFTVTQQGPTTLPGCATTDTSLCLNNRFSVTATYQTNDGSSGQGHSIGLTSDTGYFWFFGPNNVEVVIKVLDACGLSRRYWVFAGGLTNVNVTITIRDTVSGTVKTYTNPLNTAFQPIQDTGAFATCQ